MNNPRPCGCKGCRTCLICEEKYGIIFKKNQLNKENSYVYCPFCNKAWPGWDLNDYKQHPNHEGTCFDYPGVYIKSDFLTDKEEHDLIENIDSWPWTVSQSGRRKQNFGPKCNFKKNKIKDGDFFGFPLFSKFIQDKFKQLSILENFQTIEQCSLEYDPKRGACIDPHIDDCWIWGERIVTVNLLADSVLTMTFNEQRNRYNLHLVENYPKVLNEDGSLAKEGGPYKVNSFGLGEVYPTVRIPMPRKSILVLYNSARYDWEHQILREDITERRICLAYREFTPLYLTGGKNQEEGESVLLKAKHFWSTYN